MANIPLLPGTLGRSCFASEQDRHNATMAAGVAVLPDGLTGIIVSQTAPGAADQDKAWQRLLGTNEPDRLYVFSNGLWVSPHLLPANDTRREIYVGTAAGVDTLDGGLAGSPTTTTGPFWKIDAAFDGLFPIGVGTLVSGTSLTVNETGGLEDVTLTVSQMPNHSHDLYHQAVTAEPDKATYGLDVANEVPAAAGPNNWPGQTPTSDPYVRTTGGGGSHTNMPPYIAVYFIRRTSRLYYTAS